MDRKLFQLFRVKFWDFFCNNVSVQLCGDVMMMTFRGMTFLDVEASTTKERRCKLPSMSNGRICSRRYPTK